MNKFDELCESILTEGKMDKVEKIINSAGFDRAEVQTLKDKIRLVASDKEIFKLEKDVQDELEKNNIKFAKVNVISSKPDKDGNVTREIILK